jgi:glycosyltransferase involved in cell wall biosynthesis
MNKIAFVVQRYGKEIEGGCETHCRQIAERLSSHYSVEVLTTRADDYRSWENYYPAGETNLNGVKILRFPVSKARHMPSFDASYDFMLHLRSDLARREILPLLAEPFCDFLRNQRYCWKYRTKALYRYFLYAKWRHLHRSAQRQWMEQQGPLAPSLSRYLAQQHHDYRAIFFFSYNYATTYDNLPRVQQKAILVPTVHQEDCLAFPIFQETFNRARFIIFNTAAEARITRQQYAALNPHKLLIAGAGIDLPPATPRDFMRTTFGLQEPYILYVGRIDPAKGCQLLFAYFLRFKQEYHHPLKLVVMGRNYTTIPEHPDIVYVGFCDELTKIGAMREATALVLPSFFESLSLVVLESLLVKTPVLVNAACEVLKDHCITSGGGLCYSDYSSFHEQLTIILTDSSARKVMGEKGHAYVQARYSWPKVLEIYQHAINRI